MERKKADLYLPDYDRGIFRLFPTILTRSMKKEIPPEYDKWTMKNWISHESDIALILILDALGAKQNKGDFLEKLWKRSGKKKLSSIFPTTTSNGVGSIFLGCPPEEHGLISVRFFVKEIGNFINALKACVLGRDEDSLAKEGVDPTAFLWKTPLIDQIADEVKIVKFFEKQYEGGLSRFFGRKGQKLLVGNEIDMFSTAAKATKEISMKKLEGVLFLYIPLLDMLEHSYGTNSMEWKRGINFLNQEIKRFTNKLEEISKEYNKKISLFITADHGIEEIKKLVELERETLKNVRHNKYIRGIMQSGRTAFSYLRSENVEKAKEKIESAFNGNYSPYKLENLTELWPYLDHSRIDQFRERMGSLVLLPSRNTEFRSKRDEGFLSTLGWGNISFKGSHGGATEEEMEVPLIHTHFD